MESFKDNKDRSWDVDVTVATIKRVRARLDVDLLDVDDGELIRRLITDPILLVDIIYVVCEPQARDRNVSDEDFGEALAGDAIAGATKALLDSLVSFSPSPKDRDAMSRVMQATWDLMDRARDSVQAKLNNGLLEEETAKALKKFEDSFTNSLESSESTQAP